MQEFAAGNPTAITTSSYRYDGLGRRIEKVANGQTKRYIYDAEDILLEYDGSNALQARYTHGPGIDEPIAVTRGGSTFFYHQDGLGSVTQLTDNTGSLAKAYAYHAYGNILESPGTVNQPYTYTGREFDSETGLYYYRARYYDAARGRFLQKDPIGLRGGLNLYRYVRNNPSNYVDPTGRIVGLAVFIPALVESGIQAGIAITGAMAGVITGQVLSDLIFNKPPKDAKDPDGAKAPGKLGEAEGFMDPVDGEEWVQAHNGDWGWKDAEDKVWCPTGPKGHPSSHGGPHWDVQWPKGGSNSNVYPGGRVRGRPL